MLSTIQNNVLLDPVLPWLRADDTERVSGIAELISCISRGDMQDLLVPNLAFNGVWHVTTYLYAITAIRLGRVRNLAEDEVVEALYSQALLDHPNIAPENVFRIHAPLDEPAFLQTVMPKAAIKQGSFDTAQPLGIIPNPTDNLRDPELLLRSHYAVPLLMAYQIRAWGKGGNRFKYPGEPTIHFSLVPSGSASERMILEVECILDRGRHVNDGLPMIGWAFPWPTVSKGNRVSCIGLGVSDPIRLFPDRDGTLRAGRVWPLEKLKHFLNFQDSCVDGKPSYWRSTPWAFTSYDNSGSCSVWDPKSAEISYASIGRILRSFADNKLIINDKDQKEVLRPPLVAQRATALERGSYLVASGFVYHGQVVEKVVRINIPLPATRLSGRDYWNQLANTADAMVEVASKEKQQMLQEIRNYLTAEQWYEKTVGVMSNGKAPSLSQMRSQLGDHKSARPKYIATISRSASRRYDDAVSSLFFSHLGGALSHGLVTWQTEISKIARETKDSLANATSKVAARAFAKAIGLNQGSKHMQQEEIAQIVQACVHDTLALPPGDLASIRRGDLTLSQFWVIRSATQKSDVNRYVLEQIRHTTRLMAIIGKTSDVHPATALMACDFHPRRFELLIASHGDDLLQHLERACSILRSRSKGINPLPLYDLIRENLYQGKSDRAKTNWMYNFFRN